MRASFYMTSQVAKRRLVKSPKGKNRVPLHRISAHPSYHLLRAAQFAFIGDRITRTRRNEETIFTALFLLFLLFHIFAFFIFPFFHSCLLGVAASSTFSFLRLFMVTTTAGIAATPIAVPEATNAVLPFPFTLSPAADSLAKKRRRFRLLCLT